MGSQYREEQLGNGRIRFIVIPAPVPTSRLGPVVLGAISALMVFVGLAIHGNLVRTLLAGPAAVLLGCLVYHAARRRYALIVDRQRSPGGSFIASAGGIELPTGDAILRDRLQRVLVLNGVPSGHRVGRVSARAREVIAPGSSANGNGGREGSRALVASVSYLLCAEHEGRLTTLAGGMTEAAALGLLRDAGEALRLTVHARSDFRRSGPARTR